MMDRGSCQDGRVHEGQQRSMVGESARAALLGDGGNLAAIRIGHANQFDARQLAEDARVLLAQVSDADHSEAQKSHINSEIRNSKSEIRNKSEIPNSTSKVSILKSA